MTSKKKYMIFSVYYYCRLLKSKSTVYEGINSVVLTSSKNILLSMNVI